MRAGFSRSVTRGLNSGGINKFRRRSVSKNREFVISSVLCSVTICTQCALEKKKKENDVSTVSSLIENLRCLETWRFFHEREYQISQVLMNWKWLLEVWRTFFSFFVRGDPSIHTKRFWRYLRHADRSGSSRCLTSTLVNWCHCY